MATVGEKFRAAREGKNLKLAQVVDKTRIPLERLQALESDNYQTLPDDVYTRGAIRNYAIFLGLDPTAMLADYRAVRPEEAKIVPLSVAPTTRAIAVVPATIGVVVVVVLVLVALVALHVIVL